MCIITQQAPGLLAKGSFTNIGRPNRPDRIWAPDESLIPSRIKADLLRHPTPGSSNPLETLAQRARDAYILPSQLVCWRKLKDEQLVILIGVNMSDEDESTGIHRQYASLLGLPRDCEKDIHPFCYDALLRFMQHLDRNAKLPDYCKPLLNLGQSAFI